MSRKPMDQLGDLNKQIMEVVWEKKKATVREVQAELEAVNQRRYAYTSILSIMQKLEEYGWLQHQTRNRTNEYEATESRSRETMRSLKNYIKKVFFGNTRLLFEQLLEDEELSDAELKELQDLIQKKRRQKK